MDPITTREEMITEAVHLFDTTKSLKGSHPQYIKGVCELIAESFPEAGLSRGAVTRKVYTTLVARLKRHEEICT